MVQLKEVEDEAFTTPQPGPPLEDDDEYYTDTGMLLRRRIPAAPTNVFDEDSEISSSPSLEQDLSLEETLADRLLALRDVIPPATRRKISHVSRTAYSWLTSGLVLGGKTLWVVSTGAMLIGIPWALAFTEESQMMEMEREMRMQNSANEVCPAWVV